MPKDPPLIRRRVAALSPGLALSLWSVLDPRFRDVEGFLRGEFALPLGAGLALLVVGATFHGPLRRFGFWVGVTVLGQAVALQMIDAGKAVRYQHQKPLASLAAGHPFLLAALALQVILVAAALAPLRDRVRAWLGESFRPWQAAGLALVFALPSATVSPAAGRYLEEVAFATFVQAVALGSVALAAWALPEPALGRWRALGERLLGGRGRGPGRVVLGSAVGVAVAAAALNLAVYENHPHVADEVAYLHHARYLARGALTTPAPDVPEGFTLYLMRHHAGAWYPATPPGWPAVLAAGVLLGAPWLVNPVLAALNVLLTFSVLSGLYGRRRARLGALLLAASPWHLFMAMSFMNHTAQLALTLLGAWGVLQVRRRSGRARWALLAGAAAGVVGLIRPLDGLVVGGLLGLWALVGGGRRFSLPSLAAYALAIVVVTAVGLAYNAALTGHPLVFPVLAYMDDRWGPGTAAYGFGANRGHGWPIDPFPGHGPLDGLVNANLNAFAVNVELFGWGTGSLLLAAVALLCRRPSRADRAMAAVVAAVFTAYFFYYFSGGPDFGARYWFLMLVPLIALTLSGARRLECLVGRRPGRWACGRVSLGVAVLVASSLVTFIPWRAADKYHHYLGMRPDVRRLAERHGFGRSLVLVCGREQPDYASAAAYNPIDLRRGDTIYAWDRSPSVRARLLVAYADRPVWLVDGPSVTRAGFQVRRGPFAAVDVERQARPCVVPPDP
jgi:hypothetical protein